MSVWHISIYSSWVEGFLFPCQEDRGIFFLYKFIISVPKETNIYTNLHANLAIGFNIG